MNSWTNLRPIFLLYLLTVSSESATYLTWTRDRTFDNKLSTDGYNVKARSRLHCAKACSKNSSCTSFFFVPGLVLNCQLHETIITSAAGLPSVPVSMYYTLDQAVTTTITTVSQTTSMPATTHPPFSCPPDDTIFRTVQLADGNTFTYKVEKELRTQSESASSCQSLGGFLARVTTISKMDMLLDLLINCSDYDGESYYVDGSNAGATDFHADDAWVMSNGNQVPMTTDFWATDRPSNPDTEHCLRMENGNAYKWNDCVCSNTYFYICEK